MEDLRRELARQGRTNDHGNGSYTKDVAEDISDVLLEMARRPGKTRKPTQLLLDMFFRTRGFAGGAGKAELEALARELREEDLPKRFKEAARRAKKEAKEHTGTAGTTRRTYPKDGARTGRKEGPRGATRSDGPSGGKPSGSRVDPEVWKGLSEEQKAAITKAMRGKR